MESAEDIVDSTMCGCDIDPLSGRGHYVQLVVMVGLPLIPVTALAIYSSLKLAATLKQFGQLQVSCIIFCIVSTKASFSISEHLAKSHPFLRFP